MESKKDIVKSNQNIKVDINKTQQKENKIIKKDSETFHDEHGRLLFKPDEEFEVKSCCGSACNIDKGYLEFIAKFVISSAVLAFSMFQLATGSGDTSYFASTISLILGIYINNKDDNKQRKK